MQSRGHSDIFSKTVWYIRHYSYQLILKWKLDWTSAIKNKISIKKGIDSKWLMIYRHLSFCPNIINSMWFDYLSNAVNYGYFSLLVFQLLTFWNLRLLPSCLLWRTRVYWVNQAEYLFSTFAFSEIDCHAFSHRSQLWLQFPKYSFNWRNFWSVRRHKFYFQTLDSQLFSKKLLTCVCWYYP